MFNIYRVISMSLAVSLFFAAPLLCVQPISVQIKKGQRLTSGDLQGQGVSVVKERNDYRQNRRTARAAAWTRSANSFVAVEHELPLETRNLVTTSNLSVDDQEYGWRDPGLQDLDTAVIADRGSDAGALPYGSHNDL